MNLLMKESMDMILLMLMLIIIASIPMLLIVTIIFISKKIQKYSKMRPLLVLLYKGISKIHNFFLIFVLLVFFFRIARLLSISMIYITANINFVINGSKFINLQINFMLLTMMIVFYYPISIVFIKYLTFKQYKEKRSERNMVIAMFNLGIELVRKIPIEEIINIGYVLYLIYSSIVKLGTKVNSFDDNYIYLSFIIYLAINTSAKLIYKKHKDFFDRLDNRIFKTDFIKQESKKFKVNEDLKQANEYSIEFIRTGEVPKKAKKFTKRAKKYI